MSEREEIEELLAINEQEIEQAHTVLHEAQEKLKPLFNDHDALVEARINVIGDQEFLDNPELFRWLCAEAWSRTAPNKRLKALTAIDMREVRSDFVDGRDEWFGYPLLSVWLIRRQPVKELAAAIEAWGIKFGGGRPDLTINVMDRDLSEYGSWDILYDLVTKQAEVQHRYDDRSFENIEGALEYVAENAYYTEGK